MPLKRQLGTALVLYACLFEAGLGQADERPDTAPFPHLVGREITLDRLTFEAREPVIGRFTLTNRSQRGFRVDARYDGAPYAVALEISQSGKGFESQGISLSKVGPQPAKEDIELAPEESVVGESLLLLDYGSRVYVFPRPGRYTVRWRWRPGEGFSEVYSNDLQVTALPPSQRNEECLAKLELLAVRYYTGQMEVPADKLQLPVTLDSPEGEEALEYQGVQLLAKLARQQKAHLIIDPESHAEDLREAALVQALEALLEQYLNASYAGYIARFLGLVHIKTFEHVMSHGRVESWTRKDLTPEQKAARDRAAVAREKALRYLTIASQDDLWPRTTATAQLARLYAMSEQWDKVQECLEELRTMAGASNGPEVAATIESEVQRYREKLERRSAQNDTRLP